MTLLQLPSPPLLPSPLGVSWMANRPRPSKQPRSALGIPEWLWGRLDGTAIFALLMVVLGVPALCKAGVEPIIAVAGCTATFLAYVGARCFAEVSAWKREEAALNRQALEKLTDLLSHLRPARLEQPREVLPPPPLKEAQGHQDP